MSQSTSSSPKTRAAKNPDLHVLEARGLVKNYGQARIVQGVDIKVYSNEVVGLLGANGAGKTTSFNMLIGLVRQSAGKVFLNQKDISDLAMHQRARSGLGYLPQEHSVFRRLTVEQNILAVLEAQAQYKKQLDAEARRQISDKLMQEFGIARLRDKPAIQLSGGEQRRVEIARALALQPTFILLDEPFAGIDPIAVRDIQQIIAALNERGIGVLITDHNVRETLGSCDRAYILHHGKVLTSGSPQQIMADPQARKVYLGEDFRL